MLLGAVRKGEMPTAFVRSFPFHSSCIRRLVHPDPSQRPSAAELLRSVREFCATRSSPSSWTILPSARVARHGAVFDLADEDEFPHCRRALALC